MFSVSVAPRTLDTWAAGAICSQVSGTRTFGGAAATGLGVADGVAVAPAPPLECSPGRWICVAGAHAASARSATAATSETRANRRGFDMLLTVPANATHRI